MSRVFSVFQMNQRPANHVTRDAIAATRSRYKPSNSIGKALGIAGAETEALMGTRSLYFAGEVFAHLRREPSSIRNCVRGTINP